MAKVAFDMAMKGFTPNQRKRRNMEDLMKKILFTMILGLAAFLCAACVMTAGPHGVGIAIAPPLPFVVELDTPYYAHGGYHYYYNDDRWFYSDRQSGPWYDLPRDRYPREIRRKGPGWGHGPGPGRR
jgi:hypothetical protein